MAEPMEVLTIGTDEFECVDAQLRTGVNTLKAMFGNGSIFGAASGSVAHVDDAAEFNLKALSCVAEINPVQSGTGDPSPSNVRPISGYSSVNVTSAGKNLFNEDTELGTINDTTGVPNPSTTQIRSKTFSRCKGGQTYSVNVGSNNPIRVLWYDSSENFISETINITNTVITAPNNASLFKIRGTNAYGTTYQNDVAINYPSTDTAYEAYQGTTYPVSFGTTIYGGEAEVVGGTLTNKLGYGLLKENAPNFTETISTNYTTYYARISGIYTDMKTSGFIEVYCDKFRGTKTPSTSNYVCYIQNGYLNCRVSNGEFENAAAFKTWVQTNGLQLAYELAAPVEIQLTPKELEILKGNMNVWADTGDIDIKYFKNLQIIQDLIALKNDLVGVG